MRAINWWVDTVMGYYGYEWPMGFAGVVVLVSVPIILVMGAFLLVAWLGVDVLF